MTTNTPKTDAAAKRALETLQACKSSDDFKEAIKSVVGNLIETSKQLETELYKASDRSWLDEALNSGNGTYKP